MFACDLLIEEVQTLITSSIFTFLKAYMPHRYINGISRLKKKKKPFGMLLKTPKKFSE